MKAKITPFPRGASEGLLVLHIDCEGEFDPDRAANLLASRKTPGTWAIWLDADGCWEDQALSKFVAANNGHNWIALRSLGDDEWPSAEIPTIIDATTLMAAAETAKDLRRGLAGVLHIPRALDLVVDIRRPTVDAGQFAMLERVCAPMESAYAYVLDEWFGEVVRVAAHLPSRWAVRRLHG